MLDGPPVRGMSKGAVENRVQNARGKRKDGCPKSIIEKPPLSKVSSGHQGFFNFNIPGTTTPKRRKTLLASTESLGGLTPRCLVCLALRIYRGTSTAPFDMHPVTSSNASQL
ncbi:hypothetical protein F442_22609 [Phytophthora nicotianae P10297]|uniref:Uncharacterized protein n=1 Tax=Phytophthora nicotianae P10297 TaxID=1317064 RepID=W2Y048_PHYNI|nr:hypothetical protein F442_22609 [Phytophthora nicotianae P10297]